MPAAADYYAEGPEALVVSLAARGDRDAFAELVRRRQSWIRNFLRRCSGNETLADDLSQQVFLQAWRKIRQIREPEKFAAWLKRIALNEWIDHQRRRDPQWNTEYDEEIPQAHQESAAIAMDLDKALAELPAHVRLCIILSYHERMSHGEIATLTKIKLGTVKSHIRRGSKRLQELLSAYGETA